MSDPFVLDLLVLLIVFALGAVLCTPARRAPADHHASTSGSPREHQRITTLQDRVDALEREVAALHAENVVLRELLEQHQITPPRPRLRALHPQEA